MLLLEITHRTSGCRMQVYACIFLLCLQFFLGYSCKHRKNGKIFPFHMRGIHIRDNLFAIHYYQLLCWISKAASLGLQITKPV